MDKSPWAWQPPLPTENAPLFVWPPRPMAALKYLFNRALHKVGTVSIILIFVVLAIMSWFYFVPELYRWQTFSVSWILQVFVLNLGLAVLVAGGLHLYFYTYKRQGNERRFDDRSLEKDNPKFSFNNQVWDNIFWTCVSGVTIWTTYQVVIMWAYANNFLLWLDWSTNPIWFVILFFVITVWQSLHFYLTHRVLHWKPVYKAAHTVHHRNINVGPWSGISAHPIEHVIYFSTILIHFVVATHPIHMFFHMYLTSLAPMATHSGFAELTIKNRLVFKLGSFFHQLHHRYFDCNYGPSNIPLDKWFDSLHDGTPEGTARLRQRQLKLRKRATGD